MCLLRFLLCLGRTGLPAKIFQGSTPDESDTFYSVWLYLYWISMLCLCCCNVSVCGVQVRAPARATVTRITEAAPRSVRWSEDWSSAPVTLDTDWWTTAKPAKVLLCVCVHVCVRACVHACMWVCTNHFLASVSALKVSEQAEGVDIHDLYKVWRLFSCFLVLNMW